MIAWNVINFILILALFGIVIFLLIKRKKESYTPNVRMNSNIINNGNAIELINKELVKIIGPNGQVAANEGAISEMKTFVSTGGLSLTKTDLLNGGRWYIQPDKNTLSICYQWMNKANESPNVATVAMFKFIPQEPTPAHDPYAGQSYIVGEIFRPKFISPTNQCQATPTSNSGNETSPNFKGPGWKQ